MFCAFASLWRPPTSLIIAFRRYVFKVNGTGLIAIKNCNQSWPIDGSTLFYHIFSILLLS